jgi:PAS domain S-box-containing protein
LLKKVYISLAILSLIILGKPMLHAQLKITEKASWIINIIAPSTNWKNETGIKEYTIGIYGSNDIYNELTKLAVTSNIKKKRFVVINFKKTKDIVPTHILYVSNLELDKIPEIVNLLGFNTLFITDSYPGKDFMINFLEKSVNGRNIDISPTVAKKAGISFEDKLLGFAGKDEVLRGLYSKTERQLKEEKDKLNQQKAELETQKNELARLKRENKKEKEDNERQKEANEKQKKEIENQKSEIDQQRVRLEEVQRNLSSQMSVLDKNTNYLRHQEQKIKEQESEIAARNEEIKQQLVEIESNKKEIQTKDIVMGRNISQIQLQRLAMIVFIVLIALIIVLAIFIWRGRQVKQRINDELRLKNIAINRQKEEISSQQQQTELLNKELEKLSIVAAQTDNAVTIMDRDANFEWINVGYTKMYGYTLQLLKNEKDENLRNASENPEINQIIDKCIADKKTITYESFNKTRSGKLIWVQTGLTPILNQDGEISKLITIETDITRIKNAEEEIRTQYKKILDQSTVLEETHKELERLSLVASETENAISIMDAAGNFQWINDGYSRLFGYTFSQLLNEYSRNIITKDIEPNVKVLIKKCIEDIVPVTYETPWKSREGKEVWVQTTLTPITDKKNNLKSLISISSDISKLKFAEQEIRQQSEELMAQKEELVIQKDQIELQNVNIKASISYAQTIQNAILPSSSVLNKTFESFIVYKPKDIVSGDFYWHAYHPSNNGNPGKHFIAVVDCTGHGVPGAFMSMIGSQLLNEIVVEKGIDVPSVILETMHKEVIQTLKQGKGENNDGMDVCLCRIDVDEKNGSKLIFAGAKRPLYYFKNNEKSLMYIKGTRKSIGGTQARRNKELFQDHEISLNKGDLVYLTTDGMIDQPSPERLRFGSLRLIDLLKEIALMPISQQKELVEKAILEYQQFEQQRDDVTFIGVKV